MSKKYIYSLIAAGTLGICSAQVSVSQAEYFWDTDPGEGNATAVTATDGSFNSAFEKIAVAGINAPSAGLHKFSIRVKDNTGVWSPVFTNVVKVEPIIAPIPVSIALAEYYWDTDPGEGNGIAVTATDGNFNSALENIAIYGLNAPSVGLHKFSARVKDNLGVWSPVFSNVVRVEQVIAPIPMSVAQAEYFWDTDPGEGSGTAVLAADGNFNAAFEKLSQAGIAAPSAGLHTFSVRIKDNQGVWAPAFTNVVKVEQVIAPIPLSIAQAEYFWDADPGEGNGSPFAATDGNFNNAYEKLMQNNIPLVGPIGLHVFNVRVKDNTGTWGPLFKNVVYIETFVMSTDDFNRSAVIVYPNPVRNLLNISFEKEIKSVAVYSILGQEVMAKQIHATEGTIDFSNLAQGTYIVKIEAENAVKTLKVIKE